MADTKPARRPHASAPHRKRLAWLAAPAAGLLLLVVGCGSSSSVPTEAEKQAFEKRSGADEAKAREFVKQLEALPAEQRGAYMTQHPAEVRNMAIVPNPDLQMKFRKLVTNKG